MPWQRKHVPPELFVEHQGVKVWRAYKEDDADYELTWHFTVSEDEDDREGVFDIRELGPGLVEPGSADWERLHRIPADHEFMRELVKRAVDKKLIGRPAQAAVQFWRLAAGTTRPLTAGQLLDEFPKGPQRAEVKAWAEAAVPGSVLNLMDGRAGRPPQVVFVAATVALTPTTVVVGPRPLKEQ